jgi:hypothetical protein
MKTIQEQAGKRRTMATPTERAILLLEKELHMIDDLEAAVLAGDDQNIGMNLARMLHLEDCIESELQRIASGDTLRVRVEFARRSPESDRVYEQCLRILLDAERTIEPEENEHDGK